MNPLIRTLALAAAFLSSAVPLPAQQQLLNVGVAETDITPNYPVRLSGFGFRRTESEGVTQRIWAKALAFVDEQKGPAILITADNLSVPDEITGEVARRLGMKIGLKRERLTITATHTHTAPMLHNVCPTLFGVPIPPEHQKNIDRYTGEFLDALEKVALAAFASAHPSRLAWGIGTADFAVNRRTKGGPVDHDLPVLTVSDPDGKLRALYFSYACHCVTLSNNKISGDWAGYAQSNIQEKFPGVIALASVGCGADSNPSSGVTGDKVEICAQQGESVARELKRLIDAGLKPISAPPETRYARVDLPLAQPRSRQEWEARAKREDAVGHHARVALEALDRGEALPVKINYPIQTWHFGDELAIVFLPGETVVDYSLRLKKQFDRTRLWVNGYSNDGRCYIPSERVLAEGGYEGGDAMVYYNFPQKFAPGLEEIIVKAVTAQLPKTFEAPKGTEGTRPLSANDALRTIRTKPGLRVELVAAEPLIQDPVALDWAADGRLWVCEMNDYPTGLDQNWQPGGRVKFLIDNDGDGLYDRSTLFLDGLPFPTGVTAWGRGVLICAAPDILYAEDTNGDGRADKIEKLFSGFFTDNYQARVNSLSIGLDGWIYGANGLLGGNIQPHSNSLFPAAAQAVDIRNRDFRFDPRRGTFETVSGLTQQGRVRDDWGHWFGCDNSRALLHFPLTDRYVRRNPHVPSPSPVHEFTARADGRILFPASSLLERFNDPSQANHVTSACGLGIYRDSLLGPEFSGNAFTCEPVHNLVHREIVERAETISSHRALDEANSEFLSSTDHWFRPVQARTGPDGALYIVDMYRFLIEHPRWIPATRLAQLDVRAGADRGRIYRLVPEHTPLRAVRDLAALKTSDLSAALDSPNGTERDRVHIELLTRNSKSALPHLNIIASTAQLPEVRLQALALADALGGTEPEVIQRALKDPAPEVRAHALVLAETQLKSQAMLHSVLALLQDSAPLVRHQLARTLGESRSAEAGWALAELARASLTDAEMRSAILSSAAFHCGELLTTVMNLNEATPGRAEWLRPLVATAANSEDISIVLQGIKAALPETRRTPNAVELAALASLIESAERRGTTIQQLLDTPTKDRLDDALQFATKLVSDPSAPDDARHAAIGLLGYSKNTNTLVLLCESASSADEPLRHAALASLKRQRDPTIAARLLARWPGTAPSARTEVISFLLDREEWTIPLLSAIKDGIVRQNEVALSDRQRLASSANPKIRTIAAELLPTQNHTARVEALKRYTSVSGGGNPSKGAELFAANCAACHSLNGLGHSVGPDLAALRPRDADYWIKNILDPNAVVEPRFVSYEVRLKDDRSVSGLIRNENPTSLTIVAPSGVSETILRSDIAELRASTLSLMPEGLEQAVSPEQMPDLLAFLRSGGSRKQVPGNDPQPIPEPSDRSLLLSASRAEIYGDQITFEPEFQNIGMWTAANDQISWTVQLDSTGERDVYLDYACAEYSAGNAFALEIGPERLDGTVTATGPDWSQYRQTRIGKLNVPAGTQRITFHPTGMLHHALLDLRALALVPPGKRPNWPKPARASDEVLRDPPAVARFILDPTQPDAARNAAINSNPQFSAALVSEMTRGLNPGPEEYARIPWIWRVAIAAGKRNDTAQLRELILAALPGESGPLRDWQAVALGGGVINGLSQRGLWPGKRLSELLDSSLEPRWSRALELAAEMAESEKIPTGTRYDALRMVALRGWRSSSAQLQKYLAHGAHDELQMGAVSALIDIDSPDATAALIHALSWLKGANRTLALEGLLREPSRKTLLAQAVARGSIQLDEAARNRLNAH